MPTKPDLFSVIDYYIDDLFASEDAALKAAQLNARAAGLPEIQVSPGQAKLLYLMAKMVGARTVVEVGTLAGYSTIWLARALPVDGRVITFEIDKHHAQVASKNLEAAGLLDRVRVIVGPATETLSNALLPLREPVDLVFLDADKVNYPQYLEVLVPKLRSGALLLADNVIREGTVLAPQAHDPSAGAARAFNALIASDSRLEAIVIQQVGIKGHDGLAIARVR